MEIILMVVVSSLAWVERTYRTRHQTPISKTSRAVEQSGLSVALREAVVFIHSVKTTNPAPVLHTTASPRAVSGNTRSWAIGELSQSALLFKNLSISMTLFKLNTASNLRIENSNFKLPQLKSFGKSVFVIMANLQIPHQRKGQGSRAENTAVQAAQLIASPSSTSFIFISSQLYQIINSLCCIRALIPFFQAALDSGRWILGGSQGKQPWNATSGRWHCSQETWQNIWNLLLGMGMRRQAVSIFLNDNQGGAYLYHKEKWILSKSSSLVKFSLALCYCMWLMKSLTSPS